MFGSIQEYVEFLLLAFSSVFFIVDPIATIPSFLALTADSDLKERRHMARRASWTCFLVLSGFALGGTLIFRMFGITMPAFRIAGGLIMILIGLDMVQGRRSQTKETPSETQQAMEKDDVGIIPLGVPMLAGPGSISTVMALMAQSASWQHSVLIIVVVALTAIISYWTLAGADRVGRRMGDTGIHILTRFMGLLLMAIAVQFILSGLAAAGFGGIHP
ncbi:MAG TPA: MarC family protein [Bryobacteraceae bacterium]|nr:MarC family protein [Bryobacteraceae bacterium]